VALLLAKKNKNNKCILRIGSHCTMELLFMSYPFQENYCKALRLHNLNKAAKLIIFNTPFF
jgi:hypothetical protein